MVLEDFEDEFIDIESLLASNYGSDVFELDGDLYAITEEDGDDDASTVAETSVKYLFHDSTWKKDHVKYDLEPSEFTRVHGNIYFWNKVSTMLQLFEIFWPYNVLRDIFIEANCYDTEDLGGGKTYGGVDWEPLTIPGLKAFIAILLDMGMKRQPNHKSYWQKEGSIFHCPIILNIMTRKCFEALTRCLHITNPARYVREKDAPGYDKMGQLKWLINAIRESC